VPAEGFRQPRVRDTVAQEQGDAAHASWEQPTQDLSEVAGVRGSTRVDDGSAAATDAGAAADAGAEVDAGIAADAGTDAAVDAVLRACVAGKLPGHAIDDPSFLQPARGMNAIGG
jgi:hypothetical protein